MSELFALAGIAIMKQMRIFFHFPICNTHRSNLRGTGSKFTMPAIPLLSGHQISLINLFFIPLRDVIFFAFFSFLRATTYVVRAGTQFGSIERKDKKGWEMQIRNAALFGSTVVSGWASQKNVSKIEMVICAVHGNVSHFANRLCNLPWLKFYAPLTTFVTRPECEWVIALMQTLFFGTKLFSQLLTVSQDTTRVA